MSHEDGVYALDALLGMMLAVTQAELDRLAHQAPA
jgi:hypothetical protein